MPPDIICYFSQQLKLFILILEIIFCPIFLESDCENNSVKLFDALSNLDLCLIDISPRYFPFTGGTVQLFLIAKDKENAWG